MILCDTSVGIASENSTHHRMIGFLNAVMVRLSWHRPVRPQGASGLIVESGAECGPLSIM
jgi:hypothetical protein